MSDHATTQDSANPLKTPLEAETPITYNENTAQEAMNTLPKATLGDDNQISGTTNPSTSNVDARRDRSSGANDAATKGGISVNINRWNIGVDHSTKNEEILDTLASGSDEMRKKTRLLQIAGEGDAILFFEELHLRNIRQLQLRLLEFSRESKGQVSGSDRQHPVSSKASLDNLHLLS
jgi:hypothetical protein